MTFLLSVFVPSKHDAWNLIAENIGAEYKGDFKMQYWTGVWQITLDIFQKGGGLEGFNNYANYTRMRAPFLSRDGLRFDINRAGLFSIIWKLFGLDIHIDDTYFDENFSITGNNKEKIQYLLRDIRLKELIQSQPSISFRIRDDDGPFGVYFPPGVDELYYQCSGILTEERRIENLFDMFITTLHGLVRIDSAREGSPGVWL